MRRKLQAYKAEIRRLKDSSSDSEDYQATSRELDSLLSAEHEAVIRLDEKGMMIAANLRARELFNIKTEEASGSLLSHYRDAEWNAQLKIAIAALPEPTRLPEIEVANRVLTPRLTQLEGGDLLLICMDITEQHRLDQQRRTFLSNLMHDLKTPLTSLLGYARSMDKFGDDAEFRKEAAQVIADEAKHVNHLLDALLTLDQTDFAPPQLDEQSDVVVVMGQVCEMLSPQCEDKNIELQCSFDRDVELVVAMSDTNVDRVVTNLLMNAINYSPAGSKVTLSLQPGEKSSLIVIEDEGDGIPEKDLPRVTERFYRVDKARSRNVTGHGLGLAIVTELLEVNAGSLKLSNVQPHGLRAEVTLLNRK